jgi:hypothetical protein
METTEMRILSKIAGKTRVDHIGAKMFSENILFKETGEWIMRRNDERKIIFRG